MSIEKYMTVNVIAFAINSDAFCRKERLNESLRKIFLYFYGCS